MLALPSLANNMIDPTSDTVQFGGLANHKPGLKLRMTQAVSDLVKENLLQYGVAYMNWDLKIKKEGTVPIRSFPAFFDFNYYDLVYEPFKIDINNAALEVVALDAVALDDPSVSRLGLGPCPIAWVLAFHAND